VLVSKIILAFRIIFEFFIQSSRLPSWLSTEMLVYLGN